MSHYQLFYDMLRVTRENAGRNCASMDKNKYENHITRVYSLRSLKKKQGNDYKFLKRYDVMEVEGKSVLVSPRTNSSDVKYYVCDEDLFDIMHEVHMSSNHAGRDRMLKALKAKFANITQKDVQTYISLCEHCAHKLRRNDPLHEIYRTSLTRCQVDIINLQSCPDGKYKFVLLYQDDRTKFIILKPLSSNVDEEICDNIVEIFCLFGVPAVLAAANAEELANKLMNNLKDVWPSFKILPGKPSCSKTLVKEIRTMMNTWMNKRNSTMWSVGIKFIQYEKNRLYKSGIVGTPFEAMLNRPLTSGLASLDIPSDVIESLFNEDDLATLLDSSFIRPEDKMKHQLDYETDEHDDIENEPENVINNSKRQRLILTNSAQMKVNMNTSI